MDYTEAFNAKSDEAREKRKAQDLEDLDHESAGVDVGRIARHLGSENNPRNIKSKQERADKQFRTMLDLLLLDAEYRALYEDALNRLGDLENATQRAIEKAEQEITQAQQGLQDILDRAPVLDGVRVFKDKDGNVWTEHGAQVKDQDVERIEWRGDEPSHEEFMAGTSNLEQKIQAHKELLEYQTDVLGSARGKLTDPNNPLKKDELSGFIRNIEDSAPTLVQAEIKGNASEATHGITEEPQFDIEIPSGQGLNSGM